MLTNYYQKNLETFDIIEMMFFYDVLAIGYLLYL